MLHVTSGVIAMMIAVSVFMGTAAQSAWAKNAGFVSMLLIMLLAFVNAYVNYKLEKQERKYNMVDIYSQREADLKKSHFRRNGKAIGANIQPLPVTGRIS
jgi:uncharacterized membrane protein